MNSLTPDRKEFKKELEEGKGAGVWFIIIFIILMLLLGFVIHKCTYNPLKHPNNVSDTTKLQDTTRYIIFDSTDIILGEWLTGKQIDSIIATLPIGSKVVITYDEKEDLTRSIDGLFEDKLPLEKPEL